MSVLGTAPFTHPSLLSKRNVNVRSDLDLLGQWFQRVIDQSRTMSREDYPHRTRGESLIAVKQGMWAGGDEWRRGGNEAQLEQSVWSSVLVE
jgi:hypothetical protein